ncbi:hypothetical protein LINPERPRIM_LOCUS2480 [Linum perenne]
MWWKIFARKKAVSCQKSIFF